MIKINLGKSRQKAGRAVHSRFFAPKRQKELHFHPFCGQFAKEKVDAEKLKGLLV